MRRFLVILFLVVCLSNCARQAYPSALREYIKLNKYPIGANVLTIRYLQYLEKGLPKEQALKKAREDYIKMVKYLNEHNPEHLHNGEMPKITSI